LCSTITGQRVFFAGGGGGGSEYQTVGGLGGGGGGGTGGIEPDLNATAGSANTGGGGGGGGFIGFIGAAGGSGIVIIRYPATASPPVATTGSPQISYAGGYQIYTWTSSGSITF
jgi:hypothetical protein